MIQLDLEFPPHLRPFFTLAADAAVFHGQVRALRAFAADQTKEPGDEIDDLHSLLSRRNQMEASIRWRRTQLFQR